MPKPHRRRITTAQNRKAERLAARARLISVLKAKPENLQAPMPVFGIDLSSEYVVSKKQALRQASASLAADMEASTFGLSVARTDPVVPRPRDATFLGVAVIEDDADGVPRIDFTKVYNTAQMVGLPSTELRQFIDIIRNQLGVYAGFCDHDPIEESIVYNFQRNPIFEYEDAICKSCGSPLRRPFTPNRDLPWNEAR